MRGDASYDITVGRGILSPLGEALPPAARKVLVVHPPTLAAQAEALRAALVGDREVLLAEIPDAEQGKRIEVAAFCWQVMGKADFTRTDAVVGFGGGAVTDLAGFVAATWLRGVEVVQVPTTVLGMVDAAVGGKTGVNTAEGKNLVGAFWAPRAVVCDLDLLDSLSRNELVAGYAEVVKAGFIWSPEILDLIEADPESRGRSAQRRVPPLDRARDRDEGARRRRGPPRSRPARDPQLRPHPRSRDRARRALPLAPRRRDLGRHGLRRRAVAPRRSTAGCRGPASPRHPRRSLGLPTTYRAGRVAAAARDDAARQEEPGRDAALHRARRHRAPDRAAGARRVAAVRRLPGGRRREPPSSSPGASAPDEWELVRALRLESTADPDAAIAFLESHDDVAARTDEFWRERTEIAATSEIVAQFVAEIDGDAGGKPLGAHQGHRTDGPSRQDRGRPPRGRRRRLGATGQSRLRGGRRAARRGRRVGGRRSGCDRLQLDVHRDNLRAQAAYRRAGFEPTGETLTGPIGPEIVMARPLP